MIIGKIYSGGQTGVDIAALRAAVAVGIPTAGYMPRGWKTLAGPRPQYGRLFGMKESSSVSYAPRTHANVQESDATLRIALNWASAGELCTMQAIRAHGRPSLDVPVRVTATGLVIADHSVRNVLPWLRDLARDLGRGVHLNVAGNSERTAPGIEDAAERFLRTVFAECR